MLIFTKNNLRLQPLGLLGHPHSTQLYLIGCQQPQFNNIIRKSWVKKFQWHSAPQIQNKIGIQDQTSKFDERLALVATINLSYSKCLLPTTYHVKCSPHELVHQHGKCKNYGTTPMMLQGMKKPVQNMRYLQTTKHKTQGKYQNAGGHASCSIFKSAHFQKIHLFSKCCEC